MRTVTGLNSRIQVAQQRGPAAGGDAPEHLGLVAHADLAELDAGLEDRGEILHELAEVHLARRLEVEDDPAVIEEVVDLDQAHGQTEAIDLLHRDLEGADLTPPVGRVALEVAVRGLADDAFWRIRPRSCHPGASW